jgi:hypothetical protein
VARIAPVRGAMLRIALGLDLPVVYITGRNDRAT